MTDSTPFWAAAGTTPSVAPETLFEIANFPITNTMTTALLGTILCVIFCFYVQKFSVLKPTQGQLLVETVTLFFANFLKNIVSNVGKAAYIVPITASLALFLLLHNLLTVLLPFLGAITVEHKGAAVPFFRILTSDLNLALALSVGMFIITQAYALRQIGGLHHLEKFIQIRPVIKGFQQSPGKGFEGIIFFFVGILEIISTLARILSLCLRLFGNIFAGEVLLIVALSAFGFFLPSLVLLFSLVVGVIQALVFAALTASNLSDAAEVH